MERHDRPGRRTWQSVGLACVSIVALYLGFAHNVWRAASDPWFRDFQRDSESLIVGRLVQSRTGGVLSYGGLAGRSDLGPPGARYVGLDVGRPFRAYEEGASPDRFVTYQSQVALQGTMWSLADRAIALPAREKLDLFRSITALLTAFVMAAIIVWFHVEFGLATAAAVLVGTVFSPWLTVFARNLWWSTWAFFLPFAATLWAVRRAGRLDLLSVKSLGYLALAAFLVKCLFNGYEFITTAVVMPIVAIVFYGVKDRASVARLGSATFAVAAGAGIAIAITLLILFLQIAAVDTFASGVEHVGERLWRRTYRTAKDWNAGVLPLLRTYLSGTFLSVRWPGFDPLPVRYWQLFAGFAAASVLVAARLVPRGAADRRAPMALLAAAWFSALAPLSWLVIFRGHSRGHEHMNFILWQMPFTLFGFAICGQILARYRR